MILGRVEIVRLIAFASLCGTTMDSVRESMQGLPGLGSPRALGPFDAWGQGTQLGPSCLATKKTCEPESEPNLNGALVRPRISSADLLAALKCSGVGVHVS